MKSPTFYNLILFRIQLAACFSLISFTVFSQQTLRTNLFVIKSDGSKTLIDGNMTIYDDIYCNCVNWEDAIKFTNPGQNWGLLRNGTTLAVERRKFIPETDTSYIRMWNMQERNFSMQVICHDLAKTNRIGYVRDKYTNLNTQINLSDTTYINFSVNSNSGTSVQNRFSVIFEKTGYSYMPVVFTNIKLVQKGAFVNVEFMVENELLVTNYIMQHASDTSNFKDVKLVAPRNGSGSEFYNEDAGACSEGNNFYRIKATNKGGKIIYSSIAKLNMPQVLSSVNVYPNPTASRQLYIQITTAQQGKYQVSLIGINGKVYRLGTMQLAGLQSSQPISLPQSIQPGIYQLQLNGQGNVMIVKSITVL